MDLIRFGCWEAAKLVAVIAVSAYAARTVARWAPGGQTLKFALYVIIGALVGLSGWYVEGDVAAEIENSHAQQALARGDLDAAYTGALAAVKRRSHQVRYWRCLIATKIALRQTQSVLDDEPAVRALSHGELAEEDEYQFALAAYLLGNYDQVVAATLRMIRRDPSYAPPYVLQGRAYTAEKRYPEAQQSYLGVLQIYPTNQEAVEGLAHAYYLNGDRQQATAVLDGTVKFSFSAAARQRFEALKGLYEQ